jgi:hypothetical protein
MPTNISTKIEDLPELERGYVDALLDHFLSLGEVEAGSGLTAADLSPEVVAKAEKDCNRFTNVLAKIDPDVLDEVNAEIEDYELGWHLLLERQETGVGFSDLPIAPQLREPLINAAGFLKPIELEVRDDGKIHMIAVEPTTRPAV